MVNLFVAAAIAAASPALAAPASAQPAMFKVEDGDTTIYLFGTFHALNGDRGWLNSNVRDAFERSDELVLETLIPEPGALPQQVSAPIRSPTVAASASFLATTKMAIKAGRSQGMQVNNGADMVLRHIAESEGKPVEGLETLELQLKMFDKLRVTAPVQSATASAPTAPASKPVDDLSQAMSQMEEAWKRGDQAVFVRMLDQLRTGSPDTYRTMFVERNARWADWVAARLRTPGVVFIAVGAGHLTGKDSVLVRLAEKGVESRRVD